MTDEPTVTSAHRQRSVGTWVAVGVGVVVIVFGAIFASRFGLDPDLVASPLIGEPAPAGAMPYMESAGELSLNDLAGDIVVINFWASWCPGCRLEHEALLLAADAYRESAVTFVGILHQDRVGPGIEFLDEFGRGDAYRYVSDEGSRAGIDFGVLGLPTTFFLNRSGTIVGQVNGPVNLDILAGAINTILVGGDIDPLTETGELENR
ncbi:MAG: redoxin domain-containing protein [bacterium]|nr:redoxin domain-containing protein [bacterium]